MTRFAADAESLLPQIPQEPRTAIGPVTGRMTGAQMDPQAPVVLVARRRQPVGPRVIATGRDPQHATELSHGMAGLLRRDERERYSLCLAKKAAAFFRMSRSSRNCRTSRRNCINSARSSVVSGGVALGRVWSTPSGQRGNRDA